MKLIYVFAILLMTTNAFADLKRIEVFRISDNKKVAGTQGHFVTIPKLRVKMLKKGLDILDPAYRITESDPTQEVNSRRAKLRAFKDAKAFYKTVDCSVETEEKEKHRCYLLKGVR